MATKKQLIATLTIGIFFIFAIFGIIWYYYPLIVSSSCIAECDDNDKRCLSNCDTQAKEIWLQAFKQIFNQ